MFDVKMKVRYILHKRKRMLYSRKFLLTLLLFFGFVCLFVAVAAFPGRDAVITEGIKIPSDLISIAARCAFPLFVYQFFAHKLFFKAQLFYISDDSFLCPEAFCGFFITVRYILLTAAVLLLKLLWAVFFYTPAFSVLFITVRAFSLNGQLPLMTFYALLTSFIVLFLTGTAFFLAVSGRYFLCLMLFIRNPRQKTREIIKTSAAFTSGQLMTVLYYRLNIFIRGKIFGGCMAVMLSSDIFYERKYYRSMGIEGLRVNQSIPRAF